MSIFGAIMAGYCIAAALLILWCLAIEAHEAVRKRRMTPTEREHERRLAEYVEEVEQRTSFEQRYRAAQEADRRCQERARERFGR
jgi:hypothetical protein